MASKGEAGGRYLDPGVVAAGRLIPALRTGLPVGRQHEKDPLANAIHWAQIGQIGLASIFDQLPRSVRTGVVRFEKAWVANLSAKRQLSVAKLSTKRIFSLAKRDFLVANGRMAADFSSPALRNSSHSSYNSHSSFCLMSIGCVIRYPSTETKRSNLRLHCSSSHRKNESY